MRLEHQFDVPAPIETVWDLLVDLERVAPCLPGARIEQRLDERTYDATMRVSLGPMRMAYRGTIAIDEIDVATRRTSMRAEAQEARGQGAARAAIATTLEVVDGGTRATTTTDLELSGRVAQMGRGIVQDVSNRMLEQFAACLTETAAQAGGDGGPAAGGRGDDVPAAATARPVSGLRVLLAVLARRLRRLAQPRAVR